MGTLDKKLSRFDPLKAFSLLLAYSIMLEQERLKAQRNHAELQQP
jgi:hypothetical protein